MEIFSHVKLNRKLDGAFTITHSLTWYLFTVLVQQEILCQREHLHLQENQN